MKPVREEERRARQRAELEAVTNEQFPSRADRLTYNELIDKYSDIMTRKGRPLTAAEQAAILKNLESRREEFRAPLVVSDALKATIAAKPIPGASE